MLRCVTPFSISKEFMHLRLMSLIHMLSILHPSICICLLWTWSKPSQVKTPKETVSQALYSPWCFIVTTWKANLELRESASNLILSLFFFAPGQNDWPKILCKILETMILWFSVSSKVATSSVLTLWSTLKISAEIQKGSSPWKLILLDWKVTT